MADNVQVVKEGLLEPTVKEFIEVTKNDFAALQANANFFIQQVKDYFDIFSESIDRFSIEEGLKYIYSMMSKEREHTIKMVELQHNFEKSLNDFLGRVYYLAYVHKDGKISFYDDVSIEELYKNKLTKGPGAGKINSKMDVKNDLAKAEAKLNEKIQNSIAQRAGVYREAVRRWDTNSSGKETKRYANSKNTFYWRLHNHYNITGATTSVNRGHIAEGYMNAVIKEDKKIVDGEGRAMDLAIFYLWRQHIHPNSEAGILKGDIQLNISTNGEIHFAVKSEKFSTASFGQYLDTAYNITQLPPMSADEIREALPQIIKLDNKSEAFVEDARRKAEEEIKKAVESVVTT